MLKWLKARRIRRDREIARAVRQELEAQQGWEKFLPPVVLRDKVYMVTESGSIYAMHYSDINDMELITQIRTRP